MHQNVVLCGNELNNGKTWRKTLLKRKKKLTTYTVPFPKRVFKTYNFDMVKIQGSLVKSLNVCPPPPPPPPKKKKKKNLFPFSYK